jgi:hypothetical protein
MQELATRIQLTENFEKPRKRTQTYPVGTLAGRKTLDSARRVAATADPDARRNVRLKLAPVFPGVRAPESCMAAIGAPDDQRHLEFPPSDI